MVVSLTKNYKILVQEMSKHKKILKLKVSTLTIVNRLNLRHFKLLIKAKALLLYEKSNVQKMKVFNNGHTI